MECEIILSDFLRINSDSFAVEQPEFVHLRQASDLQNDIELQWQFEPEYDPLLLQDQENFGLLVQYAEELVPVFFLPVLLQKFWRC